METNLDDALQSITKQADLICHGNYDHTDEIYQFSNPEKYPESLVNFVEAFGFMTVKLEAREMHLENTIEALKIKNEQLEDSITRHNHLNFVFMNTVVLLSFFSFVLALLKTQSDTISKIATTFVVSRLIEFAILASSILLIVKSRLPLSNFGLSLKNWPRAVKESLYATVFAILCCTLFKVFLVWFNLSENTYIVRFSNIEWSFAFYFIVAPLQEFLDQEDDFAVIGLNGGPLRHDDHGDSDANATPLNASPSGAQTRLKGKGVISTAKDQDVFSFQAGAGPAVIRVKPDKRSANLDLKLLVRDGSGAVIAKSKPAAKLTAGTKLTLPTAGTYYVSVEGIGFGNLSTGYSDYGSLGQYSIVGQVPTP